jgi:hypothetical protein
LIGLTHCPQKIIITDKANVTTELDLPKDVDAACMKSMLKKYVSSGVDYDQYNYVDITNTFLLNFMN